MVRVARPQNRETNVTDLTEYEHYADRLLQRIKDALNPFVDTDIRQLTDDAEFAKAVMYARLRAMQIAFVTETKMWEDPCPDFVCQIFQEPVEPDDRYVRQAAKQIADALPSNTPDNLNAPGGSA